MAVTSDNQKEYEGRLKRTPLVISAVHNFFNNSKNKKHLYIYKEFMNREQGTNPAHLKIAIYGSKGLEFIIFNANFAPPAQNFELS